MKELKTLKDIEKELFENSCTEEEQGIVDTLDTLKAEAVKWLKALIKDANVKSKEDLKDFSLAYNIFKDFFNLTEEDLK